ncbi:agamous-like MADS-box protein AGL61 [Andrographis paniculata]|uniref:agamous-like MADS-box protein AGL61 n=1 Tax=Andrographis paniculata TaxID=175694 RepID=UPI0021E7F305|nr:agamous-like MADS-box protein AGL61 [Andrographis paniculata]
MSTSGDKSGSSQRKLGRRSIPMEKIEKKSNLEVTFSKRRAGVFKKASELCTLTGAETGVVVFSPADNAHSFGHPNINSITDKFISPENINTGDQWREGRDLARIRQTELDALARVEARLAAEKARGEELEKFRKESMIPLGGPDLDGLGYEQLQLLKEAITNFGKGLKYMTGQMPVAPIAPNVGMNHPFRVKPNTIMPYNQFSGESGSGNGSGSSSGNDNNKGKCKGKGKAKGYN